jgi:hypothetical protein
MKKYSTLILLVLLSLFTNWVTARTIYVSAPAIVSDSVSNAADGDIIELTTSGGAYTWSKTVNLTTEKSITLRATQGLASRPVITWTGSTYVSSSNTFFMYAPSTSVASKTLTVQGLDFRSKGMCYYFLNAKTGLSNGLTTAIDNCVFRDFYYSGRVFVFSNTSGSGCFGDLSVSNSEFRNCGCVVYASSSYNVPNNMTFSNCLFLGGSNSGNPFILIYTSSYNSLKIDHCTFLQCPTADIYAYGGIGTFSIKNSIFAYNKNTSSCNFGSSSTPFGTDCGFYTTTGYTSYVYPNSKSALLSDPLIQTADSATLTGYATASAYQTGSTDGKPIGYYRTTIINSTVNSITGLNYTKVSGPSAEQSFKVSGYGLSGNITITPSANFEISKTSGSSFASTPITLTQSSGSVLSTTIYVRLKSGLADNTYTGNIALTSTGASTVNVALSGDAVNNPTIYVSPATMTSFKYAVGSGPSAEQSFTISGVNLKSNLTVAAPSNYEISPMSGSSFIAMSSIPVAQSNGVVNPTTLYVRLKSGLSVNSYSQNITLSATGATTKTISLSGNVTNPPALTVSKTAISKLCYFYSNYTAPVDSFKVSGTDLDAAIVITPSNYFQVSTSPTTGFVGSTSSLTLPLTGSGVNSTTIYVRIDPASYYTGSLTGNLTVSSKGITSKTIALSGYGYYNMPSTTLSLLSLNGFKYYAGSGPSAEQSFTVSGSYLADNLIITAPAHYEISTTGGSGFSGKSTITLTPNYQSVSTTTIYVRLKSGLSGATYNEAITVSSLYATTANVALNGAVMSVPTIIPSATSLTGMDYTFGSGKSVEKSFTVSGIDLTSLILISAPANFEISTTSGDDFSPSSQLILTQSGGIASTTTIYVRMKSGLASNSYSGNISLLSSNAAIQYVSCSGTVKLYNAVNNPVLGDVKVYTSDSRIIIEGTKTGENVSVYNASGMLIYSLSLIHISEPTRPY